MPNGYTGKIARVNLSNGSISEEEHDESFYRKYYGGWTLIAYYLLKELDPGVDPLGPDNKLIFATGPVTGVPFAGNDRIAVGGKNPLTGGFASAEAGGFFPAELKHAGFDAIIVEGKAAKPVYLWVQDGKIEIRDASGLWGKGLKETTEILERELGDKRIRVAGIGPGGEKLVRFSCVMCGLKDAAGRTGMGAVMGSKNLKVIAARGHTVPTQADAATVRATNKWMAEHMMERNGGMYEHGTSGGIPSLNAGGGLPTRNFQQGQFDQYMNLAGETVTNSILIGREACYACPVRCKRVVKTGEPYNVDPDFGGPEYETAGALGSCCGVGDIAAVAKANQMCNDAALDTIAAGATVAFAMECFEKGIIGTEDTGGVELKFGDPAAMLKALELIIKREGIGNVLAEGVARAAAKLGKGAQKYAMHVKGQEYPMHEPRFKQALSIGYAVSPTGADHCHNLHDAMLEKEGSDLLRRLRTFGPIQAMALTDLGPAKVRAFKLRSNWVAAMNSLVMCFFPGFEYPQVADIASGITGWNVSIAELMALGERGNTMARAFNVREGFTAADDTLPARMFDEPFTDGPLAGVAVDKAAWERGKHTYYGMMGWNEETGVPTRVRLQELDIEWVADEIARAPKAVAALK